MIIEKEIVLSPIQKTAEKAETDKNDDICEKDFTLADKIGTDFNFKRKVVWPNALGFLAMHILAVVGLGKVIIGAADIRTFLWAIFLGNVGGLATTMGAHRLFTHRCFKAKESMKALLVFLQTLAGQNCLWIWVRDHRQHHKYTDTDADPHNATRGFFFSHMGWLMSKKHPKVIEYGKKIDMSDLNADPLVMFQKNHYKKLWFVISFLIPLMVPYYGWKETIVNSFLVCVMFRYVINLNVTWLINSWTHMYGMKPFNKNILSVDNKMISYIAQGEGWHNYHHVFPWDYRAAEDSCGANFTRVMIELLSKYGLLYDLKAAPQSMVEARARKFGDGSYRITPADEVPYEECEKVMKQETFSRAQAVRG